MEKIKDNAFFGIRDVIKTEDSRINYLRGLIRIAECDKNKTSEEEAYIYNIAELLGASYSEIWQAESKPKDDSEKIRFETEQEKLMFIMQASYLCWVDDDFSDAEREEILTIGEELGVDASEIADIESWVKQGIEWMGAGAKLLKME